MSKKDILDVTIECPYCLNFCDFKYNEESCEKFTFTCQKCGVSEIWEKQPPLKTKRIIKKGGLTWHIIPCSKHLTAELGQIKPCPDCNTRIT